MKLVVLAALLCFAYVAVALDGDTFTVNCAPLTVQRSDPIVNPGVPGTHVHSVIGGNAFRRTMVGRYVIVARCSPLTPS